MAGRELDAALEPVAAAASMHDYEHEMLTNLPRESDSSQGREPAKSARPVWLDGATAAAAQHGPPPVTAQNKRLKRGMEASPFAGLMSKKPFRRRAFDPIQEDLEEPPRPVPSAFEDPVLKTELNDDSITTGNLVSRLPSIPNVVTTNAFMQVSLSPQIWRAREREEAGKLMLDVGLQGIQLDGQQDLQLYLWSTLNPRIVTTGIPRPLSSGDIAERDSTPAPSYDSDAEESSSHGRARSSQNQSSATLMPLKKLSEELLLDEVFIVRRDPQRRIPDEVFHTRGPFDARKVLYLPDWPGDIWRFDLCCKVNNSSDEDIWIKSLDRRLQ